MGQEQSFGSYPNGAVRRCPDTYSDQIHYRVARDYKSSDREEAAYSHHRSRKSAESTRSDNSSTESSGYRSSSSAYESHSDTSENSFRTIYKNNHYRGSNKEFYKPVKIPKDNQYRKLRYDTKPEINIARLKGYLSETEGKKTLDPKPVKTGIRNYTPKIISTEERIKKFEH